GHYEFWSTPTTGAFKPTPPARGSFPLDHYGDCRESMQRYMDCLRQNKQSIEACRDLSKAYLQCRMEHGLMERDHMKNLGFDHGDASTATTEQQQPHVV
ncbi:cytochrome c oxidase assembly protein COX19, partial [Syncephalis plumigaleata]